MNRLTLEPDCNLVRQALDRTGPHTRDHKCDYTLGTLTGSEGGQVHRCFLKIKAEITVGGPRQLQLQLGLGNGVGDRCFNLLFIIRLSARVLLHHALWVCLIVYAKLLQMHCRTRL